MILRQLVVRHGRLTFYETRQLKLTCIGRTAIATSTRRGGRRWYATDMDIDHPKHRQSEKDFRARQPIPGHPDEPSSLLDAIGHDSTPGTAHIEDAVNKSARNIESLTAQSLPLLSVHERDLQSQESPSNQPDSSSFTFQGNSIPVAPFKSRSEMTDYHHTMHAIADKGSYRTEKYYHNEVILNPPTADRVTLEMLLANQCHLGHATALWHPANSRYIFGIRHGIHVISLEITLSYLRRAARVVQEVARRGGIILFIGTRKQMRQVVVTSAERAGAYHIFSRWIPGSITNGQQILEKCAVKVVNAADKELNQYRPFLDHANHSVLRPDLVICLNPLENEVCLHECGLYNIPTVGIVDTDVNPAWVTYPIPANDDSERSVALISGVLSNAAAQGQSQRMEMGKDGKLMYGTGKVKQYLRQMQEIAGMNIQEKGRGGEKAEKEE